MLSSANNPYPVKNHQHQRCSYNIFIKKMRQPLGCHLYSLVIKQSSQQIYKTIKLRLLSIIYEKYVIYCLSVQELFVDNKILSIPLIPQANSFSICYYVLLTLWIPITRTKEKNAIENTNVTANTKAISIKGAARNLYACNSNTRFTFHVKHVYLVIVSHDRAFLLIIDRIYLYINTNVARRP